MTGRGKVTSRIIKYLRQNIRDGAWEIGERIPSENELCKELGVSRVSVRNALQQMSALGILQSIHGKGTYLISNDLSVFETTPDSAPEPSSELADMEQMLELRAMIEPSICGKVAANADAGLIGRLEQLLEEMRDAVGNSKVFVERDMAFHLELCNATQNALLVKMMTEVFQIKAESHYRLNLAIGYYGGIYYHTLILEAIKKHDAKRAKAVMLEHLERGMDDLELEQSAASAASRDG